MVNPDDIVITPEELTRCMDFARGSAPTQQDIEFGQHDIVARPVDEVSRDTLISKYPINILIHIRMKQPLK